MEITITPRTKEQRAIAAMNNFHYWLLNMKNIHMANNAKMSLAYQKVYENNLK